MQRDIINAPTLKEEIDRILGNAPLALQAHFPTLRAGLRRAMETHDSVRKAHRRKSDPEWAQVKFAEGRPLFRFFPDDLHDWEIEDLLDDFARLATIAAEGGPLAREVGRFLRGLAHGRKDLGDLGGAARRLLKRRENVVLRANRHRALRQPNSVVAGSLNGVRCVSIEDIIRLGREARNCLADTQEYWKSFFEGQTDIWSLRNGDRLVAVLETDQNSTVKGVFGPANEPTGPAEAHGIARFCEVAGLSLERTDLDLLPEFAAPAVVDNRVILLGRRVAFYSEWHEAVRIDLCEGMGRSRRLQTLTLAFDPRLTCAEEILCGRDRRVAIERFGRKKVRKIVQEVALSQAAPSLVQHRLLALAA